MRRRRELELHVPGHEGEALSQDEWQQHFQTIRTQIDTDKDQKVTRSELRRHVHSIQRLEKARLPPLPPA